MLSPLSPVQRSSPLTSSPLASGSSTRGSSPTSEPPSPTHSSPTSPTHARPSPSRTSSFPTARPLRPFASIAQSLSVQTAGCTGGKKPVKLLEPPKGFEGGCFLLNLTQAEFSRQGTD